MSNPTTSAVATPAPAAFSLSSLETSLLGEVEAIPGAIAAGISNLILGVPVAELGALKDACSAAIAVLKSGGTFGAAYAAGLTALYNDEQLIVRQETVTLLNVFVQGANIAPPAA